jgi:uncharacterized protein YbaA (DUF1428 family)
MGYVDGFLLAVPRKNLAAYKKMAVWGRRIWMKYGAVQYVECVGDDLKPQFGLPFPKLMKLKPGEVPVFSWIAYKSKAHRDAVNAKVMKDPSMGKMPKKMPFDPKRMCYGGFKVLIEA